MSRIGKMPIPVPAGVDVTIDGQTVTVKGPKGELTRTFLPSMTITRDGDELIVTRPDDTRESKSAHGLTRTLLANMVEGVSNGFSKKLQLVGVGYRAALKGGKLEMTLGFSHPVVVDAIEGITSPDGRVFGKMGHSERQGDGLYKNVPGEKDQRLFLSGVRYFA